MIFGEVSGPSEELAPRKLRPVSSGMGEHLLETSMIGSVGGSARQLSTNAARRAHSQLQGLLEQ